MENKKGFGRSYGYELPKEDIEKGCEKPFQPIFKENAIYPDDYLICGFSKLGSEIQFCEDCQSPNDEEKSNVERKASEGEESLKCYRIGLEAGKKQMISKVNEIIDKIDFEGMLRFGTSKACREYVKDRIKEAMCNDGDLTLSDEQSKKLEEACKGWFGGNNGTN